MHGRENGRAALTIVAVSVRIHPGWASNSIQIDTAKDPMRIETQKDSRMNAAIGKMVCRKLQKLMAANHHGNSVTAITKSFHPNGFAGRLNR